MKENRLDQILIRLGYANEEQIKRALLKQRGLGGKLGTHLLYNQDITEEQLAEALSVQFRVPPFDPVKQRVSENLLRKFPVELVRSRGMLPLAYDANSGQLSLVVIDPEDTQAVAAVRRAIRCSAVEMFVTPEATFERLVEQHVPDAGMPRDTRWMIELPDLFEQPEDIDLDDPLSDVDRAFEEPATGVLMISDQVFLKNFLGPIFEREGYRLVTSADPYEIGEELRKGACERLLVTREHAEQFKTWVRQGDVPVPRVPVAEFDTVSAALLDNPVPYKHMFRSLIQSLKIVAESHGGSDDATPPYDLVRKDTQALAGALEMNRLAGDGLELASMLIVPARGTGVDALLGSLADDTWHGIAWGQTLEVARALQFPWDLESTLKAFRELLSEQVNLDEFCAHDPELALAAQILAVVWHHHQHVVPDAARAGDRGVTVKTEMRKKSGVLAISEVIEAYLRLIERSTEDMHATAYHQLFVVGGDQQPVRQFATRLKHLGYHPVLVHDLEEAAHMCERQSPTAVFVHDASFPEDMTRAYELFKRESAVLLYAVTWEKDPSQVLNLFDAGYDDVFSLPQEVDIIAARLRKSIKDVPDEAPAAAQPGRFQADFAALAFTDLLQALSQSQKSVRIHLARSDGEQAVIHLDRGQVVHAMSGTVVGPEAIYQVITWEEDGEFTVEPAEQPPPVNVELPLESILMEGCRLLDESRT